jgi:hypothetical protein
LHVNASILVGILAVTMPLLGLHHVWLIKRRMAAAVKLYSTQARSTTDFEQALLSFTDRVRAHRSFAVVTGDCFLVIALTMGFIPSVSAAEVSLTAAGVGLCAIWHRLSRRALFPGYGHIWRQGTQAGADDPNPYSAATARKVFEAGRASGNSGNYDHRRVRRELSAILARA